MLIHCRFTVCYYYKITIPEVSFYSYNSLDNMEKVSGLSNTQSVNHFSPAANKEYNYFTVCAGFVFCSYVETTWFVHDSLSIK